MPMVTTGRNHDIRRVSMSLVRSRQGDRGATGRVEEGQIAGQDIEAPAAMMGRPIAIAVLKTEHRSLYEVLRRLRSPLEESGAGTLMPDRELLASILYYIEEFTNRFHYPKEEQFLFSIIESRVGTRPPLPERRLRRNGGVR
jgi:hypothetical protein